MKNSIEFTQRMAKITTNENETMVSFDVQALFPSVPMEVVYPLLENWLGEHQEITIEKRKLYVDLTKLCMDNSYL